MLWIFSAFKIISGLQTDKYKLDSPETAVTICCVHVVQRLLERTLSGPFPLLRRMRIVNHYLSGTTAKAADSALAPSPLPKRKGQGGRIWLAH